MFASSVAHLQIRYDLYFAKKTWSALYLVVHACQPHTFIGFFPLMFFDVFGGDFSVSEWPGGISGGDYDKRDVSIPEPRIEADGTYRCLVCNQGFSTRQDYDDHYINAHTKEKVEKNYPDQYT